MKTGKYESAIEMYMKSSAEGRYAYKSRCEAYIAKEREDDDKRLVKNLRQLERLYLSLENSNQLVNVTTNQTI